MTMTLEQQKSMRGKGNENRWASLAAGFITELKAIASDIHTGALPPCEIPGFFVWMIARSVK